MNTIQVREATEADVPVLFKLILELAEYENLTHEVVATETMLLSTLFGDKARAHALICERDQQPIGYAIYFYNYSTWLAKPGISLEDLYVSPKARRLGAGQAMFKTLANIAEKEDCGRFEWAVLNWNQPAINFYEEMGAKPQSEWTTYRLTGAPLKALANS